MSTHVVNICDKFQLDPFTKYRDTSSHDRGINRQQVANRQRPDIQKQDALYLLLLQRHNNIITFKIIILDITINFIRLLTYS